MRQRVELESIEKRDHAEKAHKEMESLYRALFENTSYSVYIHDLEGTFIDANETALTLLGYKREEITSLTISSLLKKEDLPRAFTIIQEIIQTGSQQRPAEFKLKRKDNTYVWVEIVASLIYKDGTPYAIQGIARDITAHKKMDEILQESEQKYRTLTDNVNVGVYRNTAGTKGKFIEANPAIVKMFGYASKEEFLEINVADLYQHARDRKAFNKKILQNGVVRDEELLLKKKDGTPFIGSVSAVAVTDETGKIKHFDGIIEDITERKRGEEALRKSEEKYRTIIKSIEDGYFEVDIAGNITFLNDSLSKILGYPKKELVNMNYRKFMDEKNSKKVYQIFNAVFRTEEPSRGFGWEIIRKDGKTRYIEASVSLIKEAKKPTGFRGIVRDITERRQAEKELKESEERYRDLVELAPDGILTLNTQGYVTSFNTSALEKTGYIQKEILGKHFSTLKFVKKEDIPAYKTLFNAVLRGEAPETMETTLFDRDGKPYTAEMRMKLLKHEKEITGVLVMARDTTQRKMTEKQLKSLFEASRLINSTMDMEKLFEFVSDSVQELVGFDHFMIFLVSEDRTVIRRVYAVGTIKEGAKGLVIPYGEGLVGACVTDKETILLKNAHRDTRAKKVAGLTEPFVSQVLVPLIVEDVCVGVLHISKAVENAYSQKDVDVLKPLSEVVSSALKNSRLLNEITRFGQQLEGRITERSKRIEIILKTRQSLQRERSWKRGLVTIVDTMCELGFERCGILLVDLMRKRLEFHFGRGVELPEEGMSVSLTDTDYYGVRCILEKRTIHVTEYNPQEGKQLSSACPSFVWVPIIVQDEAFAALGADNIESKRPITKEDVKDLEILAGMCAVFIDRTRVLVEPAAESRLKTDIKYWLDSAECFLVPEKKPIRSFEIFVDLVTHGIPGFVISRVYPEKIRRKYKLARTPMLWLSRSEKTNALSPNDLSKLNYIIEDFTRKSEESVILLDGLEYLVTQIGFETVVKHLEDLKDITVVNNSRLIVSVFKGALSEREYSILEKGFIIIPS
jgi:PAS domain S-box-containing protein